jgi:hypothetical protein
MRRRLALALIAACVAGVGCGSGSSEPPGYKKEDFAKSAPPPQYRGPGQPGGPGSGPAGNNKAAPPPEVLNGGANQGN